MKAIRQDETGSYDVLRLVELEKPEPGPGQVLVKTAASSVNFADTLVRRGLYPVMPPLPTIPGLEASGTVEAVGEGVSRIHPGQRVVLFGGACYAEYVAVSEHAVTILPDGVDFEAAAALPVNYLTAYHMLHTMARMPQGSTVLVRAAAGGVGTAAAQLCRLAGIRAIGATSSREKAEFARSQGYDDVILYTEEDVAERVKELTAGRGVDVVLESVAGDVFAESFDVLAPMGQIIWFGMAAGEPTIDVGAKIRETAGRSLGVRFFVLYSVPPKELAASMQELLGWVEEGKITPRIHAALPLEEAGKAHEMLESKAVMGKVLLRP